MKIQLLIDGVEEWSKTITVEGSGGGGPIPPPVPPPVPPPLPGEQDGSADRPFRLEKPQAVSGRYTFNSTGEYSSPATAYFEVRPSTLKPKAIGFSLVVRALDVSNLGDDLMIFTSKDGVVWSRLSIGGSTRWVNEPNFLKIKVELNPSVQTRLLIYADIR